MYRLSLGRGTNFTFEIWVRGQPVPISPEFARDPGRKAYLTIRIELILRGASGAFIKAHGAV